MSNTPTRAMAIPQASLLLSIDSARSLPAQARVVRSTPPSTGLLYTRPWRSSPLSSLPPIISESEESEYPDHDSLPDFAQSRSPSLLSIASLASVSGYASRSSTSALHGDASSSSLSLPPSTAPTSVRGTPTSTTCHGHDTSQTPARPARLQKTRPPSALLPNPPIMPPPRARTVSHGHSRSASLVSPPMISPSLSIPPTYARNSQLLSDANTAKQPPSTSRDPDTNWMSSSPFGPAATPRFSRLSMASPAVVMPLSAKEYRKQKAKGVPGKGKVKEKDTTPSSHVTFHDSAPSASQSPNGLPLVMVSPPSDNPASSSAHRLDRPTQIDHHPKPVPHSSPQHPPRYARSRPRPRSYSRPNTPPRSSPLAAHPPISPKSSAGTFFSVASSPDDTDDPSAADALPPARPRPRPRRKSYPDRLSNGARLSLLEAMNRLSQESAAIEAHRLSIVSQASGHTLFYDVEASGEHELGMANPDGNDPANRHRSPSQRHPQRTSALYTQSLEELSSVLPHPRGGAEPDDTLDDERKEKRNVRMVRISDTVQVSPPPVHRRRKLTKSRRTAKEVSTQAPTPERRASLLPWRSRGSGEKHGDDSPLSTPTKTATPASVTPSPVPVVNGPLHVTPHSKLKSNSTPTKKTHDTPSVPSPSKGRRYTFSFLASSSTPRSQPEQPRSLPASVVDLNLDANVGVKPKSNESGTGSSMSIHTIAHGSESTLVPASPALSDRTPSGDGQRSSVASVPMLRRLTAQEMEMTSAGTLAQSEWDLRSGSTPSLSTTKSTTTSSPRAPGLGIGEPFVHRPSGLKESFIDTSEEDSEGPQEGKVPTRTCAHHKMEPSPLSVARRADGDDDERAHGHGHVPLRARTTSGLGMLSPGTRPGTSSSSVTTATSASYASFSTVPTSSTASTTTSRSTSPTPVAMVGEKVEEMYACAMCGHAVPSCLSLPPPPSRAASPAYRESLMEMHPMFTVPLVTVPASAASYGRSPPISHTNGNGSGGARKEHNHQKLKTDKVTTPPKVRKRPRPQTAPAGSVDLTFKKLMEQPNVDADHGLKSKSKTVSGGGSGNGESRFKTVLKNLLRWNL